MSRVKLDCELSSDVCRRFDREVGDDVKLEDRAHSTAGTRRIRRADEIDYDIGEIFSWFRTLYDPVACPRCL
jgi:hypothetical protein